MKFNLIGGKKNSLLKKKKKLSPGKKNEMESNSPHYSNSPVKFRFELFQTAQLAFEKFHNEELDVCS